MLGSIVEYEVHLVILCIMYNINRCGNYVLMDALLLKYSVFKYRDLIKKIAVQHAK